jgi:hypothetical protein
MSVIELYRNALEDYTFEQLRYKFSADVWSIGQMYDHVIEVALEYISYIEACAEGTGHQQEGKTEAGEESFRTGIFSLVKIKLPDVPELTPRQPESKEVLYAGLDLVTEKLMEWRDKIDVIESNCKVRHGRNGWLNAREWYEMVYMYSRHHLRQKAELDQKL